MRFDLENILKCRCWSRMGASLYQLANGISTMYVMHTQLKMHPVPTQYVPVNRRSRCDGLVTFQALRSVSRHAINLQTKLLDRTTRQWSFGVSQRSVRRWSARPLLCLFVKLQPRCIRRAFGAPFLALVTQR